MNRVCNVNLEFFHNQSSDFYYFLGLMATDGCVRGNTVILALIDRDVIEWLAEKISYKNKVFEKQLPSGAVFYSLSFANFEVAEILKGYGITERKTFTLQYPSVPEEFMCDFVRGVFDGDGSISSAMKDRTKSTPAFEVCIYGASECFMTGIRDVINSVIVEDRKLFFESRNNGSYKYRFGSASAIRKFGNWIYGDGRFGMTRKKRKFQEFLVLKGGGDFSGTLSA